MGGVGGGGGGGLWTNFHGEKEKRLPVSEKFNDGEGGGGVLEDGIEVGDVQIDGEVAGIAVLAADGSEDRPRSQRIRRRRRGHRRRQSGAHQNQAQNHNPNRTRHG